MSLGLVFGFEFEMGLEFPIIPTNTTDATTTTIISTRLTTRLTITIFTNRVFSRWKKKSKKRWEKRNSTSSYISAGHKRKKSFWLKLTYKYLMTKDSAWTEIQKHFGKKFIVNTTVASHVPRIWSRESGHRWHVIATSSRGLSTYKRLSGETIRHG